MYHVYFARPCQILTYRMYRLVIVSSCANPGRRYTVDSKTKATEWVEEENVDPSTGAIFLRDTETGETRWAVEGGGAEETGEEGGGVPGVTQYAVAQEDLVAGWSARLDEGTGVMYFFNTVTGAKSWERPT